MTTASRSLTTVTSASRSLNDRTGSSLSRLTASGRATVAEHSRVTRSVNWIALHAPEVANRITAIHNPAIDDEVLETLQTAENQAVRDAAWLALSGCTFLD